MSYETEPHKNILNIHQIRTLVYSILGTYVTSGPCEY